MLRRLKPLSTAQMLLGGQEGIGGQPGLRGELYKRGLETPREERAFTPVGLPGGLCVAGGRVMGVLRP